MKKKTEINRLIKSANIPDDLRTLGSVFILKSSRNE